MARFGRGEETLTDPDVRDTWEIPKHLVRAGWNDATLMDILATIKEELGLPNAAELTADLHLLLVYETNQHFLAHQDSEKDDSMVGTLVVTLPSSYAGGELMVGHNEEWKAYRGSKTALSLVAFYADCRHEVLKVTSGFRITLTYNLLLHGDTSRPEGDDGTVAELTDLLREHFSTPSVGTPIGPNGPIGRARLAVRWVLRLGSAGPGAAAGGEAKHRPGRRPSGLPAAGRGCIQRPAEPRGSITGARGRRARALPPRPLCCRLTFGPVIQDFSLWAVLSLPGMLTFVCEAREGAGPHELPRETGFAAGRLRGPTAKRPNGDPRT